MQVWESVKAYILSSPHGHKCVIHRSDILWHTSRVMVIQPRPRWYS